MLGLLLAIPTSAAVTAEDDLFSLSLEELVQLPVTTVSGVERGWFQTPAALHVISGDQARRSGLRSLPELLRLAPGVHVGRVDSRQWGIGVRGFSDLFTAKLQVLIDGRTLWGANAMNGVINVITKSSKDTQGLYLSGGGGTEERGFVEGRYGDELADGLTARVWGAFDERSSTRRPGGSRRPDDWHLGRGGVQLDYELDEHTSLSFQGAGYRSSQLGQGLNVVGPSGVSVAEGNMTVSGGHALGRLEQLRDDGSGFTLQTYWDVEHRENISGFRQERDTLEADFRHHFNWLGWNELVWGLGYRYRRTDSRASVDIALDPERQETDLATAFLQDTVTLVDDRLFLMLGTKLEHNDFTGYEVQPSARFWWTPNERHTLWTAISRPVRQPSLIETSLSSRLAFPTAEGLALTSLKGDDVDAEELIAYEAGYRVRFGENIAFDLAAFFNDYDDLIIVDVEAGRFRNTASAETRGVELSATWQARPNWRIESSYSFLHVHSRDSGLQQHDRITPRHQAQLHSYLDLTENLNLDANLFWTDETPRFDLDSHLRLDLGLTWRPRPGLELSLWGQDLLDGRHSENRALANQESLSRIERGVYARMTLRF
jgi:iron complex outermembrane receptor protein